MDHILSIVLLVPLAGMAGLLFLPSGNARLIKLWANAASLAGFLVTLPLLASFNAGGEQPRRHGVVDDSRVNRATRRSSTTRALRA